MFLQTDSNNSSKLNNESCNISIENNNSFINSILENESNDNNPNNKFVIKCKDCNNFPEKIELNINCNCINLICDCKEYENMDLEFFNENYIKEEMINTEKKVNLNEIKEKNSKIIDYDSISNSSENEYKNFCDNIPNDINFGTNLINIFKDDKINKKIDEIFDLTKNVNIENSNSLQNPKINNNLKMFFEVILQNYKNIPKADFYRIINNIYDFIKKDSNNNKGQFIIYPIMKVYFRVKSKNDLEQVLKKNKNGNAIKILMINSKNFSSYLNMLSFKDFENLIKLELINNSIRDLTPLLNSKFPVLKELNLSLNLIDDKNSDIIFEMHITNLSLLNLYHNNLKKYDIFKKIPLLSKLKKLDINSNSFNKEINERKDIINNEFYNYSNLEEIIVKNGVFSDKSINLISKFLFKCLKVLDLSANDLKSLSFIYTMNCDFENLEEFYLASNNITEFYPLIKFPNLKIIILEDNRISNIDKLVDFVDNLKQLKLIDLQKNDIDNNKKNIQIIKKTKSKFQKHLNEKDEIEKLEIRI